ncbi:MAG: HEAT repeat domain-containing protein [Candidatus Binataceae bacterium]
MSASPNLVDSPPSKGIVVSFLNSVQISVGGDPDLAENETDLQQNEYVCSFRFANLRRDGFLSLIAGIGETGRSSCSEVYIVDKNSSGFEIYYTAGATDAGSNVAGSIKDLRQDGHLELLVDSGLGSIANRCNANWTAIFAWTGSDYANVSEQFKFFYQKKIESLEKRISALQPIRGAAGVLSEPLDKECLQAEAGRIQSFLGLPSEAAEDQAIRLSSSKDSKQREFAAEILGIIGTPRARIYLKTLSKDSDAEVTYTAKATLSALSKGPIPDAPRSFQRLQH